MFPKWKPAKWEKFIKQQILVQFVDLLSALKCKTAKVSLPSLKAKGKINIFDYLSMWSPLAFHWFSIPILLIFNLHLVAFFLSLIKWKKNRPLTNCIASSIFNPHWFQIESVHQRKRTKERIATHTHPKNNWMTECEKNICYYYGITSYQFVISVPSMAIFSYGKM